MADGRSVTSAENGKKGGRPVSEATLRAQLARDYISKQLQDNLAPIVARAITQAIEGDRYAREWLTDRAFGKAVQPLSGPLEEPLFENEQHEKAKQAISSYLSDIGEGGQEGA